MFHLAVRFSITLGVFSVPHELFQGDNLDAHLFVSTTTVAFMYLFK